MMIPAQHTTRKALGLGRFLTAALLLATLGGCQAWSDWLDFWKFQPKPKEVKVVAPANPVTIESASKGVPVEIIRPAPRPQVTVFKITVPVGTMSANEKAWQQLSEDVLDSKTSVLLAQNGIRAGSAPQARWNALSKLLDVPGSITETFVCQTDGRTTLNVVTRPNVPEQIIVALDRDLGQTIRTLEKCDNGFRLSMRLLKNKPGLMIQLEPVATLGTVAVVRSDREMGVTRSGYAMEESFSDLQLAAVVPQDHFLVITAADPKESKFSIGTLWLSEPGRVPATETIMVFVPSTAQTGK